MAVLLLPQDENYEGSNNNVNSDNSYSKNKNYKPTSKSYSNENY